MEQVKLPRYFSDLMGAFETATAGGGRSGTVCRQVITTAPIAWHSGSPIAPLTVIGDPKWTNYQVSVDVLLEQAGYVELIGNLTAQVRLAGAEEGYHLKVTNTGAWTLYREDAPTASTRTDTTLASGTVTIGLNSWHTLSLIMNSGNIQALIDGKTVANVNDATYTGGQVGLLVSKWINAQFDNVSVVAAGSTGSGFNPASNYKIVNRNSGLALEIVGSSTAAGATIDQNTYTGSNNQLWKLTPIGSNYSISNVNSGLLLDDLNKATANGSPVGQEAANSGTDQQWNIVSVGSGYYTIANVFSSMVLDVYQKSKAAGTQVDQWPSNGGTNQQWSIVSV